MDPVLGMLLKLLVRTYRIEFKFPQALYHFPGCGFLPVVGEAGAVAVTLFLEGAAARGCSLQCSGVVPHSPTLCSLSCLWQLGLLHYILESWLEA